MKPHSAYGSCAPFRPIRDERESKRRGKSGKNSLPSCLIREEQIKREDLVIIGVRCGGVSQSPEDAEPLTAKNVAPRCAACPCRQTHLADHLVGTLPPETPVNSLRAEEMARLEKMSAEERFQYKAVDDPGVPEPLGAYRQDDLREFIL